MGAGQSRVEGTVAPGYESVREKFEANFRSGREARWKLSPSICFAVHSCASMSARRRWSTSGAP